MGDVERITTTELHAELAEVLYRAYHEGLWTNRSTWSLVADAALPIIERERAAERVRVVKGLIATIKALPVYWVHPALTGFAGAYRERTLEDFKAAVLAVVEAARDDTT